MPFDAQAARNLSRRMHSLQDCLAVMKRAVVQAAQAGDLEITVGLSELLPVVAGQSTNNAAFLIDFLSHQGREAWAEAVKQATRAGYHVRPAWGRLDAGPALEGLTLAWRSVPDDEVPSASTTLLMPAQHALDMSRLAQSQVRWVEAQQATIQRAAQAGRGKVSLDDALPSDAPAWTQRRDILHRAGFTTELIQSDNGATLVVSW